MERSAGRRGRGYDGRRGPLCGCGRRVIGQRRKEGAWASSTSVFRRVAYLVGSALRSGGISLIV